MTCLSGSELQLWRREQLAGQRDQAAALDWLLEIEGGLLWTELQASYLHPEEPVQLRCSLQRLEQIWQQHCQRQVPLQHLVGRCPWRDLELEVSPAVLIPRQETELLVDVAIACFQTQQPHPSAGRISARAQVVWPWPWRGIGPAAAAGLWTAAGRPWLWPSAMQQRLDSV